MKLGEVNNELLKVQISAQGETFTGTLRKGMAEWANSFGSAAKQVSGLLTGTLNTAIASTSQALTALIFKTGNWRQAFAQAAQSIVQNLIQIAIQFVVSRIVMWAINKAFGKADSQAVNQEATQAAAAWAPAATSASIASYGAASAAGLAAYLAAMTVGTAGAVAISGIGGGLAEGGRIPGFASARDNLLLPMATGEHVIRAPAVQWIDANLGRGFLDALNSMQIPVMHTGFASGGRVEGSPDSQVRSFGNNPVNIAVFDDRNSMRKWLESHEGQRVIFNSVTGQSIELGIST